MKAKHTYLSSFVPSAKPNQDFTYQALEKVLSGLMILLLSPVMIINSLISLTTNRSIFTPRHKIDALGHSVIIRQFSLGIFRKSALLINIFIGDLSFCGVSLRHSLTPQVQAKINQDFNCNAGIFSLFDLHQRTGLVDNDPEALLLKQLNFNGYQNVSLLFKSLVCSLFYGRSNKGLMEEDKFPLFGLTLNNSTMKQAVNWATSSSVQVKRVDGSTSSLKKRYVKDSPNLGFFINVNSINLLLNNTDFKHTLQQADRLFADGSGMRLAAKSAGYLLKENTNGTDMLPHLCKKCVEQGKSLYFLGSKPGVAAKAAAKLSQLYPGLVISGTEHGFIKPDQFQKQIQLINQSGCDILLVAMGSPFQETWLLEHRDKLTCETALAVGGLFDFYSGDIIRAPLFIRELGLEWVWRLSQEPIKKFTRYVIGNPLFLFRIYVLGLASKGVK